MATCDYAAANGGRMLTRDYAIEMARLGWAVLPLKGKIPLTKHGVKDATTDPDIIRKMFGTRKCNIGARVPSHIVVLDKDPQNGGSWEALEALAGCKLPDTWTVATGHPGGQHRYYIRPAGKLTSRFLPDGIDVKTDRGYCVMPPSIHPITGKQYEVINTHPPVELPPEIVALLLEPKPIMSGEHVVHRAGIRGLKALVDHIRWAPEGTRNDRVYWALCASRRDGYSDLDRQLILEAALEAGLTIDEVRRVDANARNAEPGATT